jgi:FtsP/CotA-like multicopper oxidase with cupredoxin domain
MRQNGTNRMAPTRRVVLSSGLAEALWHLDAHARSDAPAPAAQGILDLEAAPARLQVAPGPAEPVAVYAYADAIAGPLIQLRQGEELKVANKLAETTTLSFPGLRAANAATAIGASPRNGSCLARAPKSTFPSRIRASISICPASVDRRLPASDGLADRRRPPRAGREWRRRLFRNLSR